jgi:hypothetical protein
MQGFDELLDIFQFVASSEFFTRDIFLLENRNAAARVRDRKRPTYTKFLAWCEQTPGLPVFKYPQSKEHWIPRMEQFFPHFKQEYVLSMEHLAIQRELKTRFSGDLVSGITGLKGKELGELMQCLKASFDSEQAHRDFVMANDAETLKTRILEVAKSFTPKPT